MFEVKDLDKDAAQATDLVLSALLDACTMLITHDADQDIEISGFIDPSDHHGTLILHFGSK